MRRYSVLSCALVLSAVLCLSSVAHAQQSLKHPMLDSPSPPLTIGGANGDFLVHGISNKSFFNLRVKWPTDGDLFTRVPVCWENPKPEHASQREAVKKAVLNTWQLYSSLRFLNWGSCTADDKGAIHIAVGDYWPQSGLGIQTKGTAAGMKLNFDFNGPPEWTNCKATADACITKLAVHEFGHALGFMHEQTRSDTPDECIAAQAGEPRISANNPGYTTAGTPWDPDSVMNYCNPVWNNNGQLSSLDLLALQKVYGAPRQ
ncbi:M57 family metalloprotease [Bradyrhizobium paxllaeri]|uniref:M57 family metalloprotease n=1 Tax=Bradyrhizobium paxllaeri TaxID=190148 RepID=UPI000A05E215|nr:M57 family metalloprotease [Bradyrhizobium paxllaeri]